MQLRKFIKVILASATACGLTTTATAQGINLWRGTEVKADWNDAYKWKLKHIPADSEAVHFRQDNSVITVNRTVELNNGMQLYGQELSLEGNGNINLWSPIPHQRTIYVPASATGYANLTISKNISINGRVSLAGKAFGTSASKGSVTLKDRTMIEGTLSIGNDGSGSGKIFIHNKSIYHITGLELHTQAEKGGASEIHILGGTAHMETKVNPFEAFLKDPSRKIILGDYGTLRITSDLPIHRKKALINQMINQKRIVTERGCKLTEPVYQNNMVLLKAECTEDPHKLETLLADSKSPEANISQPQSDALVGVLKGKPKKQTSRAKQTKPESDRLSSLLTQLKPRQEPKTQPKATQPSKVANSKPQVAGTEQTQSLSAVVATQKAAPTEPTSDDASPAPLAGYIVFFSAVLFLLRPAKQAG